MIYQDELEYLYVSFCISYYNQSPKKKIIKNIQEFTKSHTVSHKALKGFKELFNTINFFLFDNTNVGILCNIHLVQRYIPNIKLNRDTTFTILDIQHGGDVQQQILNYLTISKKEPIPLSMQEEFKPILSKQLYRDIDYQIDHIQPITRGGTNTLCNLQYIPTKLNSFKSDHVYSYQSDLHHRILCNTQYIMQQSKWDIPGINQFIQFEDRYYLRGDINLIFFEKLSVTSVLLQILKELQQGIKLDDKCQKMIANFIFITSLYE